MLMDQKVPPQSYAQYFGKFPVSGLSSMTVFAKHWLPLPVRRQRVQEPLQTSNRNFHWQMQAHLLVPDQSPAHLSVALSFARILGITQFFVPTKRTGSITSFCSIAPQLQSCTNSISWSKYHDCLGLQSTWKCTPLIIRNDIIQNIIFHVYLESFFKFKSCSLKGKHFYFLASRKIFPFKCESSEQQTLCFLTCLLFIHTLFKSH